MSKYTITIEGDFKKGECEKCPLCQLEDRLSDKWRWHCVLDSFSENCPFEEVGDE